MCRRGTRVWWTRREVGVPGLARLVSLLLWAAVAQAQAPSSPGTLPIVPLHQTTEPCIKPEPFVRWEDYQGPFRKIAESLGERVERRSVGEPNRFRYKPGTVLCVPDMRQKFILYIEDTFDPLTFAGVGFGAALSQAQNDDASFGQGAKGYGKRYEAVFLDQATFGFFKNFAYPTIFSQDPRYYRLGLGSPRRRLAHAMTHIWVAHREDGTAIFNFSEWLGTASAVALSNAYHPDNDRGFGPAAERVGLDVAGDMAFDVVREFWPEIAKRLKLPFRSTL